MRVLLTLALLLVVLFPAQAEEEISVYASYRLFHPTSESMQNSRTTLAVQDETAFGIGTDYRFSNWGSAELDFMRLWMDVEANREHFGHTNADLISASLNFHFFDDGQLDFSVGPGLTYSEYGTFSYANPCTPPVELEDELAVSVRTRLDIALTSRLSITAGARYMDLEIHRGLSSLEIDPVILGAGVMLTFGR